MFITPRHRRDALGDFSHSFHFSLRRTALCVCVYVYYIHGIFREITLSLLYLYIYIRLIRHNWTDQAVKGELVPGFFLDFLLNFLLLL